MSERDQWRGQLVLAEQELEELQSTWDGVVRHIRDDLNPFSKIGDVFTDDIVRLANKLDELKRRHKELTFLISELKKQLNG